MTLKIKNLDKELLKTSSWAFAIAFALPAILQTLLGQNWLSEIFTIPGICFHEIGHQLFWIINPLFTTIGFWPAFNDSVFVSLGGIFFNNIAGITLLAFSLFLQSKISEKKIEEKFAITVFSMMLFAYFNLFAAMHSVSHPGHVYGCGAPWFEKCDIPRAAATMAVPQDTILFWLQSLNWTVFIIAILINLFFTFRKTEKKEKIIPQTQ